MVLDSIVWLRSNVNVRQTPLFTDITPANIVTYLNMYWGGADPNRPAIELCANFFGTDGGFLVDIDCGSDNGFTTGVLCQPDPLCPNRLSQVDAAARDAVRVALL